MEWDEYGNPIQPQQQQQPQQGFNLSREWYEDGSPVAGPQQPQQLPQPQRPPVPRGYTDAHGRANMALRGITMGANDELSGFSGGVVNAIGAGLRGEDMWQAYQRGYADYAGNVRDVQDEYRRRHPNEAPWVEGTGAALPMAGALLAGQPEVAAGRVSASLPRRMAEGAAVGSMYGYGAGFAGADGAPLDERFLNANEGALMGGVLGGALPPALRAAGALNNRIGPPAWRMAVSAAERLPTADPNAVGMSGGNLRRSTPRQRPPGPQRFDPVAGGAIERLANRSRQSPDQLERRFAEYRLNPQGQVLVDAFDQPGVQTLRSMTQSPGQANQRAFDVARNRSRAAPEIINSTMNRAFRAASEQTLTEMNRRLPLAETPEEALASLQRDYERISALNYRPVFERPMNVAQRQALDARLQEYRGDQYFERARRQAQDIFGRDLRNGDVTGSLDDNFARYAHYLKMGIDDIVSRQVTGSSGAEANTLRGIMRMRERIIQSMDNNIQGYADARAQWGGVKDAEDALTAGGRFLNRNSRDIRTTMQAMTPFERYHARIGFANEVANRIGLRGRENRNVNVADVLGSPEMQARVRAMFDSPDEAATFLDTLNHNNQLMQNAIDWRGGSTTQANQSHAADNMANAATEGAVDAMAGQPGRAVGRLRNALSLGMVERANNRSSEVLLRRVDNDADFTQAVIAELRRREQERLVQAQLGRSSAAGAGSAQRDRR